MLAKYFVWLLEHLKNTRHNVFIELILALHMLLIAGILQRLGRLDDDCLADKAPSSMLDSVGMNDE